MASAGVGKSWRALKVAAVFFKVVAVLSLVVGLWALFASKEGASTIDKLDFFPAAIAVTKEAIFAFFLWVAGDLIQIQLDTKRDLDAMKK